MCSIVIKRCKKEAFHQRLQFANKEGSFGDEWHLDAIKRTNAPMWWKEYGGDTIELQHVATHVLSVGASSGSCKRNWSAYDFIHTNCHNQLNPKCATDLVYAYCNMKLIHSPTNIALDTAQDKHGSFQMHANVVEPQLSNTEIEWEIASDNSDMDEVDDIVPVLISI